MAALKRKAGRKKAARKAPAKKKAARRRSSAGVASSIASIESAEASGDCTAREVRFCYEYVNDCALIGTKAAIAAGAPPAGAGVAASRMLKKPKIQALIADLKAQRAERVLLNADDVLRELLPMCVSDIRDLIVADKLVSIADMKLLDPKISKAIASVKQTEKFDQFGNPIIETEFKLHPKVPALALAGKHIDVRAFADDAKDQTPTRIIVESGLGAPPGSEA